ncbi:MAG: inositol monophosphatase [Pseudomonadota bacterium]
MTDPECDTLLDILRTAARAHILPRFRALEDAQTSQKTSPMDLVTIADTAMEHAVTQAVATRFPDWTVIGEEAVFDDPGLLDRVASAPKALILDPIDGTWNFAHGLPLFAVLAAVTEAGETRLGVIYDPLNDDAFVARPGQGAWRIAPDGRRTRLRTRPATPLEQMVGLAGLHMFPAPIRGRLAPALVDFASVGSYRCSAYEYRAAAQGAIDFMLSAHLKPWDHAAGVLIHAEAGGFARLLDDTPYRPTRHEGRILIAPDRESWYALRDRFVAAAPDLML